MAGPPSWALLFADSKIHKDEKSLSLSYKQSQAEIVSDNGQWVSMDNKLIMPKPSPNFEFQPLPLKHF